MADTVSSVLLRPGVPGDAAGLVALGLACLVGFALNDSGAAVPALALTVAVPVTVGVALGVAGARAAADR